MIPNDSYETSGDPGRNPSEEPLSSMDFSNDGGFGINMTAGSGRRIDRNALVLGVIVVAAVVGLWSMRTLSPTLAGESQVTALPEQVAVEPLDSAIMERLATPELVDRDLSTDRDPFAIWQPAPITDEAALIEEFVDDGIIDRETMCADWQAQVDEIAFMLNLKSVLGGGTPRALVNIEGVLLTIGETFDITDTDIEFQVEGTARRSVRLGAYNAELDCWHEVEVSMDAD